MIVSIIYMHMSCVCVSVCAVHQMWDRICSERINYGCKDMDMEGYVYIYIYDINIRKPILGQLVITEWNTKLTCAQSGTVIHCDSNCQRIIIEVDMILK